MTEKKLHPDDQRLVAAFRCFRDGTAAPQQQKLIFDYIMNDLCHFNSPRIFAGEDAQTTAFNLGKRQVWAEIAAIINVKLES